MGYLQSMKKTNKIEKPPLTSASVHSDFLARLSRVTSRARVCLHLFPPCVLLSLLTPCYRVTISLSLVHKTEILRHRRLAASLTQKLACRRDTSNAGVLSPVSQRLQSPAISITPAMITRVCLQRTRLPSVDS